MKFVASVVDQTLNQSANPVLQWYSCGQCGIRNVNQPLLEGYTLWCTYDLAHMVWT